jgi:hypothetical protein
VTVASGSVPEVEAFCARWDMSVECTPLEAAAVLVVEGPALPVQGFTEITSMYRR